MARMKLKTMMVAFLGINVLAVLLISMSSLKEEELPSRKVNLQSIKAPGSSQYSFDDPVIAYNLLEKLDIFEVVTADEVTGSDYTSTNGQFRVNNDYCSERRAYFVYHPEVVFKQQNFVCNYRQSHFLRTDVIPSYGKEVHPEMIPKDRYPERKKLDLKVDATLFFTENFYYYWKQVGVQFSCLSQASNHIPGHDKIYMKFKVAQAQLEHERKYESKPQCKDNGKYFLKTWSLFQKNQCLEFFEEFNSPRYQELKKERIIVYFRKIGAEVHKGKGIFPVDDDEEQHIRTLYQNGELCGKIKELNLMQHHVHNTLLLDNRKTGLRAYMLVASTNPVIAYYIDGYLKLASADYDPKSKEREAFITNIQGERKKEDDEKAMAQGITPDEIMYKSYWLFDRMSKHFYETGKVDDPEWGVNHLRKEIKKLMVYLIRMSQNEFVKKSSVFELYALDLVVDENLDIWFLEANATPEINAITEYSKISMGKWFADLFDIVFGLLRSRMKRVVIYINALSKETDGTNIPNLAFRRQEFRELTRNRFEPEFAPKPDNYLQLMIDENETGAKRYNGLLDKECL